MSNSEETTARNALERLSRILDESQFPPMYEATLTIAVPCNQKTILWNARFCQDRVDTEITEIIDEPDADFFQSEIDCQVVFSAQALDSLVETGKLPEAFEGCLGSRGDPGVLAFLIWAYLI